MSHLRLYPNILKAVSVLLMGGCLLGAELKLGESLLQEGYTYRVQGHQLQQVGDLKRAASSYRKAIAVHPGYAAAYNDLGVVLESLGQLPQAEEAYKAALRLSPNLGAAHSNLALFYEQMGKMQEAGQHWGARTRIGPPENQWVLEARRRLIQYNMPVPKTSEELARGRQLQIRLAVQQGREHLSAKRWDEAIVSFQKALEVDPAHSKAARWLRKATKQSEVAKKRRVKELAASRVRAEKREAKMAKEFSSARARAERQEVKAAREGARERKLRVRKRAAERRKVAQERRKARLRKKKKAEPSKIKREQAREPQQALEHPVASRLGDEARAIARDLAREKGKARGASIKELYQRGVAAMRQGRYQQAVTLFDQILTLNPEHRRAQKSMERAERALAKKSKRTLRKNR